MSDGKIRVAVRATAAHGDYPRYRAGLGPFRREPVEIRVWPDQLALLESDPALAVARLGGEEAENGPSEPAQRQGPQKARRGAQGAALSNQRRR